MMSTTKALELALEALEHIDSEDNDRDFLFPYQCTMLDNAITAIKQARSAPVLEIEYCNAYHCAGDCGQPHNQKEMRAFLTAQPTPEQEPIAYLHQCGKKPELKELSFKKNEPLLAAKGYKAIPLTSPPIEAPPLAQRKPLTDEEISSMMSKNLRSPEGTYFSFARDIEAKLKAKNSL